MLQATASRIQLPYEATAHDDDLCSLEHTMQAGWTSQIQEMPLEIQPYWNFVKKSLLKMVFYSKVQESLYPQTRHDLLKQIHAGHIGLSKCLHRAQTDCILACLM